MTQHQFQSYESDKVLLEEVTVQTAEICTVLRLHHTKKGNFSKLLIFIETTESCKTKYSLTLVLMIELNQNKGKTSGATCLKNFYDVLLTVSHI